MRPWVVAVVGVAVLLSGCAARAPPTKAAVEQVQKAPTLRMPSGASAIEGYVIDEEMRLLDGVQVSVEGIPLVTLTLGGGHFYLGPVSPGSHRILAEKAGFTAAARTVSTRADEVQLVAIALYARPAAQDYSSSVVQRGLVACGVAAHVAPPGSGQLLLQRDHYQDCQAPRVDEVRNSMANGADLRDRSAMAWAVPDAAAWKGVRLGLRWNHASTLSDRLSVLVDGPCGDGRVPFLAAAGPSPLSVNGSTAIVKAFVQATGDGPCSSRAACDVGSCALSSLVRVAPSPDGSGTAGVGMAAHQAFEATLRVDYAGEPQTQK